MRSLLLALAATACVGYYGVALKLAYTRADLDNARIALADARRADEPLPELPIVTVEPGYYAVEGTANGKAYSGVASIVPAGKSYLVTWLSGPAVSSGVGMMDGGNFIVSINGDGLRGVAVYRVAPGPELRGEWVTLGAGERGRERMRFLGGVKKGEE